MSEPLDKKIFIAKPNGEVGVYIDDLKETLKELKEEILQLCNEKEDQEFMPLCNSDIYCGECKSLFDVIKEAFGSLADDTPKPETSNGNSMAEGVKENNGSEVTSDPTLPKSIPIERIEEIIEFCKKGKAEAQKGDKTKHFYYWRGVFDIVEALDKLRDEVKQ